MNAHMLTAMAAFVENVVELDERSMHDRKIDRIKSLREKTGFGLKRSKDIVEEERYGQRQVLISDGIRETYSQANLPTTFTPSDDHLVIVEKHSCEFSIFDAKSRSEADRVASFVNSAFDLYKFPRIAKAV